jgi:hypothetical protein
MTEEAADALIRDHAGRAYWVARQKSWEADSEAKSQYWSRVAMRIFLRAAGASARLFEDPEPRSRRRNPPAAVP